MTLFFVFFSVYSVRQYSNKLSPGSGRRPGHWTSKMPLGKPPPASIWAVPNCRRVGHPTAGPVIHFGSMVLIPNCLSETASKRLQIGTISWPDQCTKCLGNPIGHQLECSCHEPH